MFGFAEHVKKTAAAKKAAKKVLATKPVYDRKLSMPAINIPGDRFLSRKKSISFSEVGCCVVIQKGKISCHFDS